MAGRLVVYSGPSGVGKGTILEEVLKDERYVISVSTTTRKPRVGEVEGESYYFVSKEEFLSRVEEGEFLEYATFSDNMYGTSKSFVESKLAKGYNVILEIEVDGAMQVKKSFPEAYLLFIMPPSIDDLRHRLELRNTDSPESIELRLKTATTEIEMSKHYDSIVVNDDLEKAIIEVKQLLNKYCGGSI